jgi:hypothetical protein
MGIKDQFQDKAERLQREAERRVGQKRDEAADRAPSRDRAPQRDDERSRRAPSEGRERRYDEDTI